MTPLSVGNTNRTPKARLVVLGYEDPSLHLIQRDSSTLSKLGRLLLLQYAASCKWNVASFDVKTTFLRGTADEDRLPGLEPPEEMKRIVKLGPNEIVQLQQGAYGRADAPLLWFRELSKGLVELGFKPSLFALPNKKGETIPLVGVHVDDGIYCGTPEMHEKIQKLSKRFPFGSQKHTDFVFTGLHISQQEDFSIHVDQTEYVL